jgi:hypothetical protein
VPFVISRALVKQVLDSLLIELDVFVLDAAHLSDAINFACDFVLFERWLFQFRFTLFASSEAEEGWLPTTFTQLESSVQGSFTLALFDNRLNLSSFLVKQIILLF